MCGAETEDDAGARDTTRAETWTRSTDSDSAAAAAMNSQPSADCHENKNGLRRNSRTVFRQWGIIWGGRNCVLGVRRDLRDKHSKIGTRTRNLGLAPREHGRTYSILATGLRRGTHAQSSRKSRLHRVPPAARFGACSDLRSRAHNLASLAPTPPPSRASSGRRALESRPLALCGPRLYPLSPSLPATSVSCCPSIPHRAVWRSSSSNCSFWLSLRGRRVRAALGLTLSCLNFAASEALRPARRLSCKADRVPLRPTRTSTTQAPNSSARLGVVLGRTCRVATLSWSCISAAGHV